jgi:hypothetical protein
MNDLLDIIDDIKELHVLYKTGDLRDFDFAMKLQKYQLQLEQFEKAMEVEYSSFFKEDVTYNQLQEAS